MVCVVWFCFFVVGCFNSDNWMKYWLFMFVIYVDFWLGFVFYIFGFCDFFSLGGFVIYIKFGVVFDCVFGFDVGFWNIWGWVIVSY